MDWFFIFLGFLFFFLVAKVFGVWVVVLWATAAGLITLVFSFYIKFFQIFRKDMGEEKNGE